jgi:signal transduction histidine kinase
MPRPDRRPTTAARSSLRPFPPLGADVKKAPSPRQLACLNGIFGLCLGVMALYLGWFHFVYQDPRFDVALGVQVALVGLAPVLYRVTKSYTVAAWYVGLLGSLYVVFHAFIAGGFASPGLFWVYASPLTLGILVRRRGVLVGGLLIAATLAWFALVGPYPGFHDFMASREGFQREVLFNMTTFVAYGVVTTHVFISNEDHAVAAIERKKHEIDSLLRIVLHDIASPLTAVRAEVALLADDLPEGAAARDDLARIDAGLERAITIISGVRSVRAVKDGKLGLAREVVDLAAVVAEVAALFGGLAREKRVKLHVLGDEGPDVVADRFVLTSIVLPNLVSNALKFTPEGRAVELAVTTDGGRGVVRVRDEGIGIPTDLLATVFAIGRPTTRLGTRGETGTGYGLPIVHEYLGTMDGTIAIRSSVEPDASGTEVEISLPLAS